MKKLFKVVLEDENLGMKVEYIKANSEQDAYHEIRDIYPDTYDTIVDIEEEK